MGCLQFIVVKATHILDVYNLEDVMDAGRDLPIGFVGIHEIGAIRKVHEHGVSSVLLQQGIVLIRQSAPQTLDGKPLAPLEFADEGYTIEKLAIHVPKNHGRGIAVVEELHVVDGRESIVLHDVREIGLGHDEQGERHLVPLVTSLGIKINLTPRLHPEALVDGGLGKVVVVVATKDVLEAGRVADGENWGIKVDRHTALLGVDEGLARGKTQLGSQLRGAEL